MPTFEELLAALVNPGEDGTPESIYDDLSASYTDATSTRDAKITEQGELIATLTAEVSRLKSATYDLMVAAQASDDSDDHHDNDNNENEDGDDVGDVDDFFKDKE